MKLYSTIVLCCVTVMSFAQTTDFKWMRSVDRQTVRDYSCGMSAFYENGKWGFLDISGNVVVEPSYDEVRNFSSDLCLVSNAGKWGVINKKGKLVHQCEYDSISDFDNGIAFARQNGSGWYLYAAGRRQQLSDRYVFHPYSDGFARIKDSNTGKWGFVDSKGVIRIAPEYDKATDFKSGHALVSIGGKTYSINKSDDRKASQIVLDDSVVLFDNGSGYMSLKGKDGLYTFIPSSMDKTIGEFLEVNPVHDGLSRVKDANGKTLYLNENGKLVLALTHYDGAGDFHEGLACVYTNGRYGYVDATGGLVIDTVFTYASNFNSGLAYVASGNRQGVIRRASENDSFPQLSISKAEFVDAGHNGVADVDEDFNIEFTVKNTGNESLNDVYVTIRNEDSQAEWFEYDTRKLSVGSLAPGQEKELCFSGKSNAGLISELIKISLVGEADNLYNASSAMFDFQAAGISSSRPVLETFWVYTPDHSPLTPGHEAILAMTVRNNGTDMAKDVTVNLSWPEGIQYADKTVTIPSLAPGESTEVSTTFVVSDSDYQFAKKEFSVVANVDEFTHKRNDIKYISFETGKRNVLTNLITGVSSVQDYAVADRVQRKNTESELLFGLEQVREFADNRFAFIIGNEDYNSMKQTSEYQPDVEFAERDAETFAQFATKMMGVKKDNVILLKNATYAQMKTGIDKLTKLAKSRNGDLELIVYYAGHGQVDGESKESYLIPVDVSITSPTSGMRLEDFYATLSSCKAKKTMVFMDACYSGVGRGIIIRPKEVPVSGNLVVMTATSSTQRSMPYKEKSHGLFTYFLLKTLKDAGPSATISDIYDSVSSVVRTKSILVNNMEQTPELLNGPDIDAGWKNWTF